MKNILSDIHKHCKNVGMQLDSKGYVANPQLNLVDNFSNWSEIKNELDSGQGSELKPDKSGVTKFNAVHSSSALCVNNFALLKRDFDTFTFLNYSNFKEATFEKKLPTGISIPNLDFYLESETTIIGFESKYTEYFNMKLPNKDNNLNQYSNRKELSYLPVKFTELINKFIDKKEKLYLDVAQLLKHSMGLIKKNNSRRNLFMVETDEKPVLVYIYWEPLDNNDELFKSHRDEVNDFKNEINPFVTFISMTYQELWSMYENDNNYKSHFDKVKERYCI